MYVTERWRAVVGYERSYEVSDLGRVRSLDRSVMIVLGGTEFLRRYRGQVLTPRGNTKGYLIVGLSDSGRDETRSIHALVLEAFVGPCPPGQEGRHLNGDRRDSRLSNLAWGSRSANAYDKVRHGTHHQTRKTHCPRQHPLVAPNLQPTTLRAGRRECYACSKALKRVRDHRARGVEVDPVRLADAYYAEIMKKWSER